MDQIEIAQAALDQQWKTYEGLVETLEAVIGMAHKNSLITGALTLVTLEIRTRQARRALEAS